MSLRRTIALFALAALGASTLAAQEARPVPAAPAPEGDIPVVLVDESAPQVVALLEKLTGRMALRGGDLPPVKINFNPGRRLTEAQAITALESLLALNGIAVIPEGDAFLKVVLAVKGRDAAAESPPLHIDSVASLPASERMIARLFSLKNIPVATLEPTVKSMVNNLRGGNYSIVPGANAILVTDSLASVKSIEAVVDRLDRPNKVLFIPLVNTRSSDVVKQLKALQAGGLKTGFAGDVSFEAGDANNRVVVVTNPANEERIREIITGIDADNAPVTRTEVVRLQHGDAAAAVTLIQNVVTGTSGSVGQKNQATFTAQGSQVTGSAQQTTQTQAQRLNQNQQQQQNRAPQQTAANTQDASAFSGTFTANADLRSNAVVLFGTERDIKQAKVLIDSLDAKLPEVLIEVIVMEVTLGNEYANGLDQIGLGIYSGTQGITGGRHNGDYNVRGNTPGLPSNGVAPLSIGASIKDFSLEAVLNKVRNDTHVKLLSSPSVRTTHNGKAVVVVSTQQPIVQATTSTPLNNGVTTNSQVEYKDIGLELDIIPRIGANGSVEMDIQQSVKDIIGSVTIDNNSQPIISNRAANSYLTAENNETVVLAGLQSVKDTKTKGKLFLLGYIPWLGDWLFSPETTDTKKSELIIFIKPHIISDADKNLAGNTPGLRSGSLTKDEANFRNKNGVFGTMKEETTYFERDAADIKKDRDAEIREHDERERKIAADEEASKVKAARDAAEATPAK